MGVKNPTLDKEAGKGKPARDILRTWSGGGVDQESRQREEPVDIILRLGALHGAPRPGGDMRQPVIRPAHGTSVEIKPKAERGQQAEFPAHIEGRPDRIFFETVEEDLRGIKEGRAGMVAFIEGASQQRADRCNGIQRQGEIDQARRSLS